MHNAIHIRYWASTIRVEDRRDSNKTDGCIVVNRHVARGVIRRLRAKGCAIHSTDPYPVTRPDCGPIFQNSDEYFGLGALNLAELQALSDRRYCVACGNPLNGNDEETSTHCRWCVTCGPAAATAEQESQP